MILVNKLDWYIIRKFVFTFVFILLILVIICIIFDFSERIDDYLKDNVPLKAIVFDYYLNFIPWLVNTFSALFVFITVIFFTSNMASRTEWVASLAAGISFNRMLRPYFIVSIAIALFSYMLNSFILPGANKTRIKFEVEYIHNKKSGWTHNIHQQVLPGEFIYIQNFNVKDKIGYKFTLEKFQSSRLIEKTEAERIQWNDTTRLWKLENLVIRHFVPDGQQLISKPELTLALNAKPDDFGEDAMDISTMTDPELKRYIGLQKLRGVGNISEYYVELYKRKALPFAGIILTFIGVCIASRKVRGGIGMHLFLGIALAFSYILFMQISYTFATFSDLNPFIAVWIPNFIYMVIAIFIYRNAPK
jgi:lipopolysaccharide export system permease protein